MKDLAQLRSDAHTIFYSGVKAADPGNAVQRSVKVTGQGLVIQDKVYNLACYDGIYVIGAGKAAAAMAQAVEARLGRWLKGGIVNVKYGHGIPLKRIEVNEAGHPVPDEAGIRGADRMIQLLKGTGEKDLVLFLVSGGGSALLPCPAEGLTLADKQKLTQLLLECSDTLHELNAVRNHLFRQLQRKFVPTFAVVIEYIDNPEREGHRMDKLPGFVNVFLPLLPVAGVTELSPKNGEDAAVVGVEPDRFTSRLERFIYMAKSEVGPEDGLMGDRTIWVEAHRALRQFQCTLNDLFIYCRDHHPAN